ncbi:MAG: hypothetical protein ACLFQV_13890 [Vulcanimicrobiota bacterium]
MSVASIVNLKSIKLDPETREEIVKILTYIASICAFLFVIFACAYFFVPGISDNYEGFRGSFPLSGFFGKLVGVAAYSISHLITYIFLALVGVCAYLAADYLENDKAEIEDTETE